MTGIWSAIVAEAAACFRGPGGFPLRAYSEFMPPPWVALKPYEPGRLLFPAVGRDGFAVAEFEEARELRPGLERVARRVAAELVALGRGDPHGMSHALLRDNPAWPAELSGGARVRASQALPVALSLALSRTQDDKGRVRWTMFGASHLGPARAFWSGFRGGDPAPFLRLVAWWLGIDVPSSVADLGRWGLRVVRRTNDGERPETDEGDLPAWARPLLLGYDEAIRRVRAVLTFEPFARLPAAVRGAFLEGGLRLLPWPASLLFGEHRGYRRLARDLPLALQVPLLHLFPRSESSYGIRIPQSGWLDEEPAAGVSRSAGHRLARRVVRTHRWQRTARDADLPSGEAYEDQVTVALFSTDPDDLGLYGKPMARNAQIWTEEYDLLLDGPAAGRKELLAAADRVLAGGRFGYRFFYPPMRAGARSLFWHRPLVARVDPASGAVALAPEWPLGFLTAERPGAEPLELRPRILDRDGWREAALRFERDPGHARFTTAHNVQRILEASALLGGDVPPSFARSLLDVAKDATLAEWIARLPERATERTAGEAVAARVRSAIGADPPLETGADGVPRSRTFERTRTRAFEDDLWRTMRFLSGGPFRDKDNADRVLANQGRTGGDLGQAVGRPAPGERDLDRLAGWLHERYREKIARHGMDGRAFVADQRFRWETDFDLPWSEGWLRNRRGKGSERNLVLAIPGRDRRSVVVLADHYDTAYMEDLYDPGRGGDRLRAAAAGADDDHSATAALLAAADVLLPLSRDGLLERSIWLVHLTGEEFPADCLGARALVRSVVEGNLALATEDGRSIDLAATRLAGVFVMDMIGHNHDRDRDTFQIAPGEGKGSARLARVAHLANERWNRSVPVWNRAPERRGRGRAARVKDGREPPPVAGHPAPLGEVRPEWDHRSALYNTDGQIFSDAGVPVVLFMENYDLQRAGYHDTRDTMENIDLDYCAALAAIAIESVAEAACAKEP